MCCLIYELPQSTKKKDLEIPTLDMSLIKKKGKGEKIVPLIVTFIEENQISPSISLISLERKQVCEKCLAMLLIK